MTVKDVLSLVVQYLGEKELGNTTLLDGETTPNEQQTNKINFLITCVNDVLQSMALLYFPLKIEEEITNSTQIFNYSLFSKQPLDILKIVDINKARQEWCTFPTYLKTKAGTILVTYTYLPSFVNSTSASIEVDEMKVSKRMLAMAVISRYFLLNGMYTDANAWERMFEKAVLVAKRNKTAITMPKRSWI